MPCHGGSRIGEKWTDERQVYQYSSGGGSKNAPGKGAVINAYLENDYQIMAVTTLDAIACFFFSISTLVLCGDAREEAIQDEYVARVRASIY